MVTLDLLKGRSLEIVNSSKIFMKKKLKCPLIYHQMLRENQFMNEFRYGFNKKCCITVDRENQFMNEFRYGFNRQRKSVHERIQVWF